MLNFQNKRTHTCDPNEFFILSNTVQSASFETEEHFHASYRHDDIRDLPENSDPADVENTLQKEIMKSASVEMSFMVKQYLKYL